MGMHEKIGFAVALLLLAYLAEQDIREQKISLFAIILSGSVALLYLAAGEQLSLVQVTLRSLPGILLLFVALLSEEGIGYGDGVTVLVLGLWTSVAFCLFAVSIGLLLAGVCAIMLLLMGKKNKQIPFIPFLLAAMEVLLIYV